MSQMSMQRILVKCIVNEGHYLTESCFYLQPLQIKKIIYWLLYFLSLLNFTGTQVLNI